MVENVEDPENDAWFVVYVQQLGKDGPVWPCTDLKKNITDLFEQTLNIFHLNQQDGFVNNLSDLANISLQGINPRHIVDGHREKTLSLLWQIIFNFQVSPWSYRTTHPAWQHRRTLYSGDCSLILWLDNKFFPQLDNY